VFVVDYFSPPRRHLWTDWITPHTGLAPSDFDAPPRREAWRFSGDVVWELLPPP
jgi:hypothetical protein